MTPQDTGASLAKHNKRLSLPDPNSFRPERFTLIHERIVRLAVGGHSPEEIADECGVGTQTVRRVLGSETARQRIIAMTAPLQDAQLEMAVIGEAADVLALSRQLELLENESTPASTRASIAKDIRDRHGAMRREGNVTGHVPVEMLTRLRKDFLDNNNGTGEE